ncbi:MAG: L-serine ammonia-lyase, iron-sulfur-dependent, subunit alpha [Sedimentisphaerales bacterium]|nr:L-serine ammonia-lyase, iron-sulfur-dependent, subunit alpha [Sedimentisphaerales bacterium]
MTISIFNDVIGPVMRGPSSSHCAAALRIGRLARDLMDGDIEAVSVEFDRHGSLATTHASQGSDMGLFGGLLGWEATDERLADAAGAIGAAGVEVSITIDDFGFTHPNTYRLILNNARQRHTLTALSTGGGMIEIVEIDGFVVSMVGDYAETLLFVRTGGREIANRLAEAACCDEILVHTHDGAELVECKGQEFVPEAALAALEPEREVLAVKRLRPVLPVLSRARLEVPFATCKGMFRCQGNRDVPLWKLAATYEAARGNLSEPDVLERMLAIVRTLRTSLAQGLEGTEYRDRILGYQCGRFAQHIENASLLDAGMLNRIILYVTALMEVKSAMGVIVAAPTAGACAALPGAVLGAADAVGRSDDDAARAMLAGGIVGVFIATGSTFAAEVAGCQAECGAASGMAAAALATLGAGSAEQAVAAASMALQNSFGMVCDPVANRVEVPCLGKNVMAASNALACANMALAGYDPVIPLDEVIEAMDRVGRSLPHELRCTALGGLSVTGTSKAIEARLQRPPQTNG